MPNYVYHILQLQTTIHISSVGNRNSNVANVKFTFQLSPFTKYDSLMNYTTGMSKHIVHNLNSIFAKECSYSIIMIS